MMGFQSRTEAEQAGTAVMAQMKTTGWKLRVWENDGWHWELLNYILSLHQRRHEPMFWALVTDNLRYIGTGAPMFSDPENKSFEDPDPNQVVVKAMAHVTEVVVRLTNLAAEANRRLKAA